MSDLDARLERLEKESLVHAWQSHRMFCLKLAAKLGAPSPEQAIEMAEKLSAYILIGKEVIALRAENARLRAVLTQARQRIFDCKHNAMFSSKDTVVTHVAELLPSIDDALTTHSPPRVEEPGG